jgi:predicted aspartyl protease
LIEGVVDDNGVPLIMLTIGERTQAAVIDTGFNGDLELPEVSRTASNPRYLGTAESLLAAGQSVIEDVYAVTIPFDGRMVEAVATFTAESTGLIGTRLLKNYRLEIDFVERTLLLTRIDGIPDL